MVNDWVLRCWGSINLNVKPLDLTNTDLVSSVFFVGRKRPPIVPCLRVPRQRVPACPRIEQAGRPTALRTPWDLIFRQPLFRLCRS